MKTISLIVVLVLISSTASARTWWGQKDGSGDFTVIQDAVDVAASGDTIRIGPGEFFDGRWWELEHCTFIGGSQGIQVDQGSNLRVSHCEFLGQTFIGMCLLHGAEVKIDHSTFDDQVQAIRTSEPPNSLYANNCQFSNISEACFFIYGAGTLKSMTAI